jgi:predicted CDP-diglyceride synthetase/phosphatidate cytidylyltransferase
LCPSVKGYKINVPRCTTHRNYSDLGQLTVQAAKGFLKQNSFGPQLHPSLKIGGIIGDIIIVIVVGLLAIYINCLDTNRAVEYLSTQGISGHSQLVIAKNKLELTEGQLEELLHQF